VWDAGTGCQGQKVCEAGVCKDPPNQGNDRSAAAVCARWKKDYPTQSSTQFKQSNTCDSGSISQGSIDDAIRRLNVYRWLVGLQPTSEKKSLSEKAQKCSIIHAHNDPSGNPHSPPSSSKCYNAEGGSVSGQSNLSWGVDHPAKTVAQYISDERVPSLGHRLWAISPGLLTTGFGMAKGTNRYQGWGSCMFVFEKSQAPAVDVVAFPPAGNVPIEAMGNPRSSLGAPVKDWSFHSSKYPISSSNLTVTLTRKGDGNVQTLQGKYLRKSYGMPGAGISFRPAFPSAGESYTVKLPNGHSYDVNFVSCP
jgi:hypothetical protein